MRSSIYLQIGQMARPKRHEVMSGQPPDHLSINDPNEFTVCGNHQLRSVNQFHYTENAAYFAQRSAVVVLISFLCVKKKHKQHCF